MRTPTSQSLFTQFAKRYLGLLPLVASCCLCPASAEADLYVGSRNGSGLIYHYSSDGSLLGSTEPRLTGGPVGAIAVQAGTGKVIASSGGNLYLLNADLSSPVLIGNGFGAFTSVASQSTGNFVTGVTGDNMISNWNADGGYGRGVGYGWEDAHIAVGLNNNLFVTANFGGVHNLGVFNATYDYVGTTKTDVGKSIVLNPLTGQIWTAGNSEGRIYRFDASGNFIDEVGNSWSDGLLASSKDGKVWLASSILGGSLSAWDANGQHLNTYQTNLGSIAAITIDPSDGSVFVGLTDASGGIIKHYSSEGLLIGSFGSDLDITSMVAIPEPSTVALLSLIGSVALLKGFKTYSLSR